MAITILPHEEDPPLASSITHLKLDLKNVPFWHDLQNWLHGRITLHQKNMETASDMMDIVRSQTIIGNCRDILDLPEMFIKELEQDKGNDDE